jgi:hypothetical protein
LFEMSATGNTRWLIIVPALAAAAAGDNAPAMVAEWLLVVELLRMPRRSVLEEEQSCRLRCEERQGRVSVDVMVLMFLGLAAGTLHRT